MEVIEVDFRKKVVVKAAPKIELLPAEGSLMELFVDDETKGTLIFKERFDETHALINFMDIEEQWIPLAARLCGHMTDLPLLAVIESRFESYLRLVGFLRYSDTPKDSRPRLTMVRTEGMKWPKRLWELATSRR